jgi:peptide/nickel transport system substrate-binding protein
MRRALVHAALGISLLTATAACGAGTDPNPAGNGGSSDTLTLAIGADLDSTDPAALISGGSMQRIRQVVESLTTLDEDGTLQPELATDWTSSEDGLTWTFNLRNDVTFSDGEPFNADAVKFSIDRLLGGEVTNVKTDAMAIISQTTVVDDDTVEFTLSDPYPALPTAMFQPMAGIISPKSITENGNTMQQIVLPVGTGPYLFEENVPGDHLTLTRNDDYWGDEPEFETQIWKVVPEAATRMALLRSGEADIVIDPPGTELAGLEDNDDFQVQLVKLPQVFGIFLNELSTSTDAFKNKEVRQALSYAIDRDSLVKNLVYGAATVYDGPLPEFDFGYCAQETYSYDPDKAEQMLAEAGFSDLTLNLAAPNGRYLNDYAVGQAVAGDLRKIGVTVNLAPAADFPTYLSEIYAEPGQNKYDASMIALGSIFLDGGHGMRNYRSTMVPPTGYNGSYYDNPEFDALMDQVDTESDEAARADLICQAQTMLTDEAATVWLYAPEQPVVVRAGLSNLTALPSSFLDPSTVTAD